MDVARRRGIRLDGKRLAAELGCPVVPVVAVNREGCSELQARILTAADGRQPAGFALANDECVEQAVAELGPRFSGFQEKANTRWLALKLLEYDPVALGCADLSTRGRAAHWRQVIEDRSGTEADLHIADTRYGHAHTLARRVIRERGRVGKTLSYHIDRVVLSRVLGIPLFLAVMNLMFVFTINLGGAFIDLFDGVADALFVLLHFPCVATLAAIVRETGAAWASFVAFWTTSIAYIAATLFYQGATFERHPMSSVAWIAGCLILLALRGWATCGRAEVARVGGM